MASRIFAITAADNLRLAAVVGPFNENLRQIEQRFSVRIQQRAEHFNVEALDQDVADQVAEVIQTLYADSAGSDISLEHVHITSQAVLSRVEVPSPNATKSVEIELRRMRIACRNPRQIGYVQAIRKSDLSFGVGPAGTGKTYLAVAAAVEMLEKEQVRRLVLVRPAVEAGEKLGFLPGDMAQKVDPYLRPIYDALYEFLGFDKVAKLIERNVIEIAPLAFMRGRTLNHAAILMDEAQNTTVEQMKMFLTRIGFGSRAIVTGDVSQVDLPRHIRSGLAHALEFLPDVQGVELTYFQAADVVRHNLVQRIVRAYETIEAKEKAHASKH